jgi:integrase
MTEPSKTAQMPSGGRRRRPKGTGTITQRADGRWEGRLPVERDGTGRRPRASVYGASRTEVGAKLADAIAARKAGREPADRKTPLGDYLERWLADTRPRIRLTTYRSYEGTCRVLLTPRLGAVPIGFITPRLLAASLADIGDVHGARSARVAHAVLRTALASAERSQVVPRNVATLVVAPSARRVTPEPWSIADGQRFLKALAGRRDEALYTLAVRLGLRQGELLALGWDDVDLDKGLLTVRHTLVWLAGAPHLGPTKSEASRRRLHLSPSLVAVLRAHRARQDAERAGAGAEWLDNDLVFCAPNGRPLRGDVLTHRFHRFTEGLGLRQVRFHDLRRLAAGLMIHSSGNVAAAGLMLGHSRKSSLTADLYAYLPPEMAEGMVEGVERLLAEVGERLEGDAESEGSSLDKSSDWSSERQLDAPRTPIHERNRLPVAKMSDGS